MKVVNLGNIADAFRFDNLPATGIVIEATPEELELLPNLAYKDVTISEHVGNAAKMREALKEFVEYSNLVCKMGMFNRDRLVSITKKARDAITIPPRNCDVGTAEEQAERFAEYCDSEACKRNRCKSRAKALCIERCAIAWAQMPYEEVK